MALSKKHIRLTLLLLLLPVLFGISRAAERKDELVIDTPDAYREKQRTAVLFPHELHVGDFECLACHHDYKDGENILDENTLEVGNPDLRCAACHNDAADTDLEEAYHHQCIGCHRQFRIHSWCEVCDKKVWLTGSAPGPELCGECHTK